MGTPDKHFATGHGFPGYGESPRNTLPACHVPNCCTPQLANAKRVQLIQLTRLLTRPTLPCSLRFLAGAGEWQVRCSRAGKWA